METRLYSSLPNYDQAIIDPAKFIEYSMNPHHPENQGKADGFKQLGYDVDIFEGRIAAMLDVVVQLRAKLKESPALLSRKTFYGLWYEVRTEITGPNGKKGTLATLWQYDIGTSVPRLLTNWLEVHK
ncbi:hypothetical protein FJZ31_22425 [Candidatus Poribacteria bacterium]|nr:hypothetical protein [Candidatus Poribacteria bacterium]